MSAPRRIAGWTAVAALLAVAVLLGRAGPAESAPSSLPMRLLGPVSSAAAGVQWVRVRTSMHDGRTDQALARAQLALELDPGATGGWLLICAHLAFDRASATREPDPERRLAWVRAALRLAARGERTARAPAELAQFQGLLLGQIAQADAPLPWPGGARALWLEAAEDFERSARLGARDGEELAAAARRHAAEAEGDGGEGR